jgi:hypothetical protein
MFEARGATLTRSADACADKLLTLRFGGGAVDARVAGAGERPPQGKVERKPRRSYVAPQPHLFDPPRD